MGGPQALRIGGWEWDRALGAGARPARPDGQRATRRSADRQPRATIRFAGCLPLPAVAERSRWIGDRRWGRWHRPGYGQRLGGLTSPGPRAYAYIIHCCSLYVWPRASPPSLGQSDLIASVDPEISRSDRRYTDLLGRINLVRPLRNLYCITLYY